MWTPLQTSPVQPPASLGVPYQARATDAIRAHLLELAAGIHHLRADSRYCRSMPSKRRTERRVATAVRLPESLHHQLQDQADLRDVSVNFLVVRAVTKYLQSAPDPLALEEPVARPA